MLTVIPISNPTITLSGTLLRAGPYSGEPWIPSFANRESASWLEVLRSDAFAPDKIWCGVDRLPPAEARALACMFVRSAPFANGRTVWDLLIDERSRAAVETAERHCQGVVTNDELAAARAEANIATWAIPLHCKDAREAAATAASAAWSCPGWSVAMTISTFLSCGAAWPALVQLAIQAIEESQGA